jgi:hypothetical protein
MIKWLAFQGHKGWFNICKSINTIQSINRIKDKKSYDYFSRVKKAFDKIQHLLMVRYPKEMRSRRNKGYIC